jgi:hypothetical protein
MSYNSCRDFSTIAAPLYEKTSEKRLEWTEQCERSFHTIRAYLTSEKVLTLPDFEKPFKLETDASNIGIGAVLSQIVGGKERPIGYFSQHLNKSEKTSSTSEKKLFAIVRACEHFKYYLVGKPFVIMTDHQPLKWLMSVEEPASRLARWLIRLAEFDFKIEYKQGKQNSNADALSRFFCLMKMKYQKMKSI